MTHLNYILQISNVMMPFSGSVIKRYESKCERSEEDSQKTRKCSTAHTGGTPFPVTAYPEHAGGVASRGRGAWGRGLSIASQTKIPNPGSWPGAWRVGGLGASRGMWRAA